MIEIPAFGSRWSSIVITFDTFPVELTVHHFLRTVPSSVFSQSHRQPSGYVSPAYGSVGAKAVLGRLWTIWLMVLLVDW
jgi:hypothetical protein